MPERSGGLARRARHRRSPLEPLVEMWHARPARHERLEVWRHRRDGGLLQHDFADPNAIWIGTRARRRTPGDPCGGASYQARTARRAAAAEDLPIPDWVTLVLLGCRVSADSLAYHGSRATRRSRCSRRRARDWTDCVRWARQSAVAAPMLGRRGFAGTRVVAEWPSIVGDQLAGRSLPERVVRAPGGRGGGTLHVRDPSRLARPGAATPGTADRRTNQHLFWLSGGNQIEADTGPIPERRLQRAPPCILAPADAATVERLVAPIEDGPLQQALRDLGRSLLTRTSEHDRLSKMKAR